MKKLLENYPSLTVSESFFGLNQTVIAGALFGSLAHEDRKLLANHISNKLQGHIQGRIIKLKVSWSKIHGATEQESVSVNLIRCQKEDYEDICKALQVIYGKDSANQDYTCPQMKFIPMPVIKSIIATTNTFICKQQHFEKNTMTFSIRNLRPPDTIIHYKDMEDSKEYDLTVWEIFQNLMNKTETWYIAFIRTKEKWGAI